MDKKEPSKILRASVGNDSIVTTLNVRAHTFTCDETPRYGGHDTAPDPYDYIMAGLASCTAITLRMYADNRNIPLESADITIEFERKPADGPDGKPDLLTRTIKLNGDLTEAQRAKLIKTVNCPAHRSIATGIPIVTDFVQD